MTAIGELLRAVFEAGTWTSGYKPDIIYVFDESQFKSESWTNSSKLFIFPAIPPEGGEEYASENGLISKTSKHIFLLMRNDHDDDKLDTQRALLFSILAAATCTGYDENYITKIEEHVDQKGPGVKTVALKGIIEVKDWVY